jgi:cytidyltransferase-like protein
MIQAGAGLNRISVSGAFDDVRSGDIRFLHEAAKLGKLTVILWPDEAIARLRGKPPRFSLAERRYYLESLRSVESVMVADIDIDPDALPAAYIARARESGETLAWALAERPASPAERPASPDESPCPAKLAFCAAEGLGYRVLEAAELAGFPDLSPPPYPARTPGTKRVFVTGCFDWLHTGHVRFFEEASEYGELNVVIGSDANLRLLKGEGPPAFPEAERAFVAGSIRTVARCLVASGSGWLDAEPEMRALGADRYLVNEDGDKPEKREFCEKNSIEYIVLKRVPKEGLPARSSTDLKA